MTETPNTTETAELELHETSSTESLLADIQTMKQGQTNVLSTVEGDDRASKLATLSAMTDSKPVDDILGEVIDLANFVIQPIEMPDEETKVMKPVTRIILIDKDGQSYHAISGGIFSALKNIAGILGMPGKGNEHWPIEVSPVREKTRAGRQVFTLKVVG